MKLYYSETSPYARKVRLMILEKGLQDQVELQIVDPFSNDAALNKANPLGKVPVLIIKNNNALFDSSVICQYLDRFVGNGPLVPAKLKWNILRWQALADGLMDAAYLTVMERKRFIDQQSTQNINAWASDIDRCLMVMNKEYKHLGDDIHLGHLAFASAIGYVKFRLPHLVTEETDLMTWFAEFNQRPSMQETSPL